MDTDFNTTDFNFKEKTTFPYAVKHLPVPRITGSKQVSFPLSTYTEFDPLKEIIVGYLDSTASINEDLEEYGQQESFKPRQYPEKIVTTGAETVQTEAKYFESIGIKVVRVGVKDWSEMMNVGGLKTFGFHCFSPRDIPFTFGDSFYEFPTYTICRSGQYRVFQWIEEQLKEKGAKIYSSWASVPKQLNFRFKVQELQHSYESEEEYFGDAANLIKLGTDIVFLISMSGSVGLYKKFKALMQEKYDGKVRVHPVVNVYNGVHIDTTICVVGFNKRLNKFLAFVDGGRVTPTNVPAIFRGKNWALIDFTQFEMQFTEGQYQLSSNSIGMNFLPIHPELIIISDVQKTLKKFMEFYGITPVPMSNKYTKALGGGLHCTTNDIHREDVHGFGKILSTPTADLTRQQRSGFFDSDLLQLLESKGEIEDWTEICNKNHIFPTYTYDHLPEDQARDKKQKHRAHIANYKSSLKH